MYMLVKPCSNCLVWNSCGYAAPLACIYMDLRNVSCLISTSGHHWERDGSRQKPGPLDKWIRCFSSANQNANHKHWIFFSAYTKWVVFCIVHCMMQAAMMAYINVQCILDCLPVSVSTEPAYSDDQFANSYSNPYKLYINVQPCFKFITDQKLCHFGFKNADQILVRWFQGKYDRMGLGDRKSVV